MRLNNSTLTQPCIHARPRIPRDLLSVIPGPAPHACKPAWDKASITHMMTSVPGRKAAACRVRTQPSPAAIINPGISCVLSCPPKACQHKPEYPEPYIQLCQAQARPTSGCPLAPGTPGTTVQMPGHGSACQWASTSPRTWLHKLVSRHQPQDPIAPDCPPGSQH